jgi:thioesterase domain-containing protein/acyl carrier protein
LLQERLILTPSVISYSSRLSQKDQWLLSEHRLKTGKALIPGTGYLEMAAAAFSRGSAQGPLELRDVFFLNPLTCAPAESREVRVQLTEEQNAGTKESIFRFSVFAKAEEWVEHSTGQITQCRASRPSAIDLSTIAARCRQSEVTFDNEHRTKQERYFEFGPRWHCLKRVNIGDREGLAELELDERFSADSAEYRMHPALLDLATGCSLYLTNGYESSEDIYLPFSYKKFCLFRSLPNKLFSHIRARQENLLHGEIETFDLALFDDQGQVLAEIEGFSMLRVTDPAKAPEERPSVRGAKVAPGEQPIEAYYSSGIPPHEGVRALVRILQTETPPAIVVLGQPLEDLGNGSITSSPVHSIPAEAGTSKSARGIEAALATWWQELLGVEQVGIDDDFFVLGGHSLIGVRLFAKIKKAFQVDLELAVLFDARTVRQLAEVIRKAQQSESAEPRTWTSLVPIQPKGARTPLFCVHAVGGDVIFYEQLARALGTDQPFYAFQSPLVLRRDIRKISIEDMASIYVNEMRSFFPSGPYLIGGASFGGLVAFEMAKQLHALGVEPSLLVLFDASVPGHEEIVKATDQVSSFWRGLRNEGVGYLKGKAIVKRRYWGDNLIRRVRLIACAGFRLIGRSLPVSLHYFQMEEAHKQALTRYVFKSYLGKVTLMRAIDRGAAVLSKREHPTLGWGPLAEGGLEIHDVETGHMSMLFEPYVTAFVEQLRPLLHL